MLWRERKKGEKKMIVMLKNEFLLITSEFFSQQCESLMVDMLDV